MMPAFYVENTFYLENTFYKTCVTDDAIPAIPVRALRHTGLRRDLVYKEKRPTIQVSSLYRMCSLCRVLKET